MSVPSMISPDFRNGLMWSNTHPLAEHERRGEPNASVWGHVDLRRLLQHTKEYDLLNEDIVLTGFERSFNFNNSFPPDSLPEACPPSHATPEPQFGERVGFLSEVLALACTVFEIRTGQRRFSEQSEEDTDRTMKNSLVPLGLTDGGHSQNFGGRSS
ncbi:hypothetical protein DFP72DRAFT_68261 [Ephemerocybe angulata]|uniref:Uncharacterized protein n=1 Tax=Ephemerocybe angulata TaxID=980116 RepID=A0A8H6LXV7_9AGAR|nr:hypothetical protein DFP72DRAFT_68261 [Tulosesus angulatus]